jgi:hypothetical protein
MVLEKRKRNEIIGELFIVDNEFFFLQDLIAWIYIRQSKVIQSGWSCSERRRLRSSKDGSPSTTLIFSLSSNKLKSHASVIPEEINT